MAKDIKFWFNHDYQARNDDKILELRAEFGAEGYGVFWMLIETMADSESAEVKLSLAGGLAHGYGVPKGKLIDIIKFCVNIGLLVEEEGVISSRRIKNHKNYRKEISDKNTKNANKSWEIRRNANAPALPPQNNRNAPALQQQSTRNAHNITEDNNTNTVDTGKPIMTEKEFKDFGDKLKKDQLFLEPLFSSGLKKEFLEKWILRFHVHIVGEEKINKDYGEYRKHFKNWLNKQDYTNPPPVLSALEKIKQTSQSTAPPLSYLKRD